MNDSQNDDLLSAAVAILIFTVFTLTGVIYSYFNV
jgi:hypothetical protein